MRLFLLISSLAILSLVWFLTRADEHDTDIFDGHRSALMALSPSETRWQIFEGLPHPRVDPRFQREAKRSDTIEFLGERFYEKPIDIPLEKVAALCNILGNPESYQQWLGEKLCDGFHADWAVEVITAGESMRFFICFGCHEIKLEMANTVLRFDMARGVALTLKSELGVLHSQLPEESRYHAE